MARPVYSSRLWAMPPMTNTGTVGGPIVPDGFVWVVRDVRMVNTQSRTGEGIAALVLSFGPGLVIAATPTFGSVVGELYSWQGRAVGEPGDFLEASSNALGWEMVVDGYQLTVT